MKRITSLLFCLFLFISCSSTEEQLDQLFSEHWDWMMNENPLFATGQGDKKSNNKLPKTGLDASEKNYEKNRLFWEKLHAINRERLNKDAKLNYDIFELQLSQNIRGYELNDHLLPLNGWWDYHASFANMHSQMPFKTEEDYTNYLQRLEAFPEYNVGYLERLKKGIDLGVVRPKIAFESYLPTIKAHITDDIKSSVFFTPFKHFPESFDEQAKEDLQAQAIHIIAETVIPEYRHLLTFLQKEYIPAASDQTGITSIHGGEAYYSYLIEKYTTLKLSADDIHNIGLKEVKRIRGEMEVIVKARGFVNDFEGFISYLRTDPSFYTNSPEELLKETAYVLKTIDGKLPELFKTIPRLPYGIKPIPDYLAPSTATAYYNQGAKDGSRAGFYAVNTFDLQSRPLYEIIALSLHEAVPGHHFQISLQQELTNLPKFRSSGGFTTFVEGWALYAERLGLDMNLYEDDYDNFGRLSYEMWRALRLVVDTGIHAKGWTREQAISYMALNSALSLHNIESEVNRYIFWPGQALAYKMGEIKIRELRKKAEQELGSQFDLREFHDVILSHGSIPLSVLESNVDEWIHDTKKSVD